MEPVFRTLEIAAEAATRVTGTRITYHGLDNLPARGGAVVAINHTGYLTSCRPRSRPSAAGRMRFMIKAELDQVKVAGYLLKRSGTIPVDRRAGAGAYAAAVLALRAGELVGVSRGDDQPQLRTQGVQDRCGAHGDRGSEAARPPSRKPAASRGRAGGTCPETGRRRTHKMTTHEMTRTR